MVRHNESVENPEKPSPTKTDSSSSGIRNSSLSSDASSFSSSSSNSTGSSLERHDSGVHPKVEVNEHSGGSAETGENSEKAASTISIEGKQYEVSPGMKDYCETRGVLPQGQHYELAQSGDGGLRYIYGSVEPNQLQQRVETANSSSGDLWQNLYADGAPDIEVDQYTDGVQIRKKDIVDWLGDGKAILVSDPEAPEQRYDLVRYADTDAFSLMGCGEANRTEPDALTLLDSEGNLVRYRYDEFYRRYFRRLPDGSVRCECHVISEHPGKQKHHVKALRHHETGVESKSGAFSPDVLSPDRMHDAGNARRADASEKSRSTDINGELFIARQQHDGGVEQLEGVVSGKTMRVYGGLFRKAEVAISKQGDNVYGFKGTCGLVQTANALNMLERDGRIKHSENEIANLAFRERYCYTQGSRYEQGGTDAQDICHILERYGVSARSYEGDLGLSPEQIAQELKAGKAVILGVNSKDLYESVHTQSSLFRYRRNVNHAISVLAAGYESSGHTSSGERLAGFFICDSGRGRMEDRKRFISRDRFDNIYTGKRDRICIVAERLDVRRSPNA